MIFTKNVRLWAVLVLGLSFLFCFSLNADNSHFYLPIKLAKNGNALGGLNVHIAIYHSALETTLADVLYLHGLGDQAENHKALFKTWNEAGFRVIAMDLPSHGQTKNDFWHSIQAYSFEALEKLYGKIEKETLEDNTRPLLISGWSTGGLLAVRFAQHQFPSFSRKPSGLILFAPGVSVYSAPWSFGCFGMITKSTLSQNHDRNVKIKPRSPYFVPGFALRLLWESRRAKKEGISLEYPTLVMLAGDKQDRYVSTPEVKKWATSQKMDHASVLQFKDAFHELDNEPGVVGEFAKNFAVQFSLAVLNDDLNFFKKYVKIAENENQCVELLQ